MKWIKIALVAAVFVAANAALLGIALRAQDTASTTTEPNTAYTLPQGMERLAVSDIKKKDTTD